MSRCRVCQTATDPFMSFGRMPIANAFLPPDMVYLLAWNHRLEILEKESTYTNQGGKWLVHVPKVEVFP